MLRVRDKAILLQTMLWPDEVRKAGLPGARRRCRAAAAGAQDGRLAGREHGRGLRAGAFSDDYREAVVELIDAKLERGESATAARRRQAAQGRQDR